MRISAQLPARTQRKPGPLCLLLVELLASIPHQTDAVAERELSHSHLVLRQPVAELPAQPGPPHGVGVVVHLRECLLDSVRVSGPREVVGGYEHVRQVGLGGSDAPDEATDGRELLAHLHIILCDVRKDVGLDGHSEASDPSVVTREGGRRHNDDWQFVMAQPVSQLPRHLHLDLLQWLVIWPPSGGHIGQQLRRHDAFDGTHGDALDGRQSRQKAAQRVRCGRDEEAVWRRVRVAHTAELEVRDGRQGTVPAEPLRE
mmetsp:Transcript_17931/g.50994  ORF Transcript_17931/g.50994 Transcript_17931/m.50994 type:complete len:258 (-) Transcript_17931:1101-1874(-)